MYSVGLEPVRQFDTTDPSFMSDFFRAFNRMIGQKQRATMAYRPQANGAAERMVQTITRSIKMYVSEVDQKD